MNIEAPRLELDVDSWGTFRLVDLFDIEKSQGPSIKKSIPDKNGVPFISSGAIPEGFMYKIKHDKNFELKEGNCLNIPMTNAVLYASYRERGIPFLNVLGNSAIFRLKNKTLNPDIAQFLVTTIRLLSRKYSLSYIMNTTRLKQETIKLPQTPTGEPDWDFMENYIQQLKDNIPGIPEVQAPVLELDVANWDEFNMIDLFDMEQVGGVQFMDTNPGDIPLIRASKENEGLHSFISKLEEQLLHKGNCITRPTRGDVPHASYRKENQDFTTMKNISIYRLKSWNLTREIGLFLTTVFRLLADKYSYGYTINKTRMKAETIKLPTTANGTPDWDFMENYIKQIEGN